MKLCGTEVIGRVLFTSLISFFGKRLSHDFIVILRLLFIDSFNEKHKHIKKSSNG